MSTFNTARTTASLAPAPSSAEKTSIAAAIDVLGASWATNADSAGLPAAAFSKGEDLIQEFAAYVGAELRDETS